MVILGPTGPPGDLPRTSTAPGRRFRFGRKDAPAYPTGMRFDQAVWQGIGDLLRVGLIDRTWRDRVRPELRERFDRAYDEAERHYGGSAH